MDHNDVISTSQSLNAIPFQEMLDAIALQIYVANAAGKLVWVNEAACKTLGYTREALLKKHVFEVDNLTDEDDWKSITTELNSCKTKRIYSQHINHEGELIHVEIHISTIQFEGQLLYCGFSRDISEEIELSNRVNLLNQRYVASLNTTSMGFWVVSAKGQILQVNNAYLRMSGFEEKEVCGKYIWNFDAVEQKTDTRKRMASIAEKGAVVFRSKQRKKDGSLYPVEVETSYIDIDGGMFFAFIKDISEELEQKRRERRALAEVSQTLKLTVYALAATLEKRDPYTAGHEENVARISVAIGKELGLKAHTIEGLELGAIIHDIGKIQVPTDILTKPTALSEHEYAIIKEHPEAGADLLKNIKFNWPIEAMVRQHHERLDGSGYPDGLKDEDIIIEAKIIAVADTLDSMASHRPYRPAVGLKAAMKELQAHAGTLYDKEVVAACVALIQRNELKI